LLAKGLEAFDRGGESTAYFARAAAVYPDYAPAHRNLFAAYFYRAEYTRAFYELARVLQLEADDLIARFDLGRTYWRQNRLLHAEWEFYRVLRYIPPGVFYTSIGLRRSRMLDREVVLRALAELHLEARHYGRAERYYKQALALSPEDHSVRLALGRLYLAWRPEEAEAQFQAALEAGPGYQVGVLVGDTLRKAGYNGRAEKYYQAALALRPEGPEALHGQALAYAARGEWAGRNSSMRVSLADLWLRLGHLKEAEEQFRAALAINKRTASAYRGLGDVSLARGARDEAAASYRRALELDYGLAEPHWELAEMLYRDGRRRASLGHWRSYLAARRHGVSFPRGDEDERRRRAEEVVSMLEAFPGVAETPGGSPGPELQALARVGEELKRREDPPID